MCDMNKVSPNEICLSCPHNSIGVLHTFGEEGGITTVPGCPNILGPLGIIFVGKRVVYDF